MQEVGAAAPAVAAQADAATPAPAQSNPALYRGVKLMPSGRYSCRITLSGRTTYVGTYDTAKEAAEVYDATARRLIGSSAQLNFAGPGERSVCWTVLHDMCAPARPYNREDA